MQEAALAHTKGGTVGAYARSDLFDKRRALMEAWGRYCTGATEAVRLVAGDRRYERRPHSLARRLCPGGLRCQGEGDSVADGRGEANRLPGKQLAT